MLLSPLILASLGIVIAGYIYFVELQVEKNSSYKAMCDLSDTVSCTKVAKSRYAKMFGISNALLGLVFYVIVMVLALLDQKNLILLLSLFACLMSVYLAYIMLTKIKSSCLMCIVTYVINGLLVLSVLGC